MIAGKRNPWLIESDTNTKNGSARSLMDLSRQSVANLKLLRNFFPEVTRAHDLFSKRYTLKRSGTLKLYSSHTTQMSNGRSTAVVGSIIFFFLFHIFYYPHFTTESLLKELQLYDSDDKWVTSCAARGAIGLISAGDKS